MDSAPHRIFIKVLVLLTTLNSQLTTRNENVFVQSQNEKKKMKLSISSIRKSVFMLPIIHFLPTPLCLPFLSWSADRGCRCHRQLSFQRESWQPSCNPFTSTAPGLSSTKKNNNKKKTLFLPSLQISAILFVQSSPPPPVFTTEGYPIKTIYSSRWNITEPYFRKHMYGSKWWQTNRFVILSVKFKANFSTWECCRLLWNLRKHITGTTH